MGSPDDGPATPPQLPVRRVLLVDDDEGDFALVEALFEDLERGHWDLEWVGSWQAGLTAMCENQHDLYLVDHGLGARTGIELLESAAEGGCTGPRILLTGNRDPRLDRLALAAGATDFLYKQTLTPESLARSLRFALQRDRLMIALRDQASQLAGGIAHDFNNMLMGVVGSLDLAVEDPTCSLPVRTHLARARSSAERASDLSGRLLAYARRRQVPTGIVDLVRVIRDIEPALARRVEQHGRLVVELPEGSVHVGVGEGELEEILLNLVANATQALQPGGTVRVEMQVVPARGRARHVGTREHVRLSVIDDGQGMPPQVMGRVFEPFFTTRRGRGGTGLGLAMVHEIVTGRGGRVELESQPGRGTRLDLLLPRVAAPPPGPPADSGDAVADAGELGLILVVDDEVHIREILDVALTAAGARVITASDAETALARVREEGLEPDLLITDLTMPGMSGFELRLQLCEVGLQLPTLFITGYGSEALDEIGVDPDLHRVLDKPFRLHELLAQVRSLQAVSRAVGNRPDVEGSGERRPAARE